MFKEGRKRCRSGFSTREVSVGVCKVTSNESTINCTVVRADLQVYLLVHLAGSAQRCTYTHITYKFNPLPHSQTTSSLN